MRKCRTVIDELEIEHNEAIKADSLTVFALADMLGIAKPTWASAACLAHYHEKPKIDISFFDDIKEFFIWYSRLALQQEDRFSITPFLLDKEGWRVFAPPTLIGVHLHTKLRD